MKKFMNKVQSKFDQLDLDKGNAPAAGLPAPAPLPGSTELSAEQLFRYRKQRGVNLGSWFTLESWLTPSLFQKAKDPKGSELDVLLGDKEAKERLERHWDGFIDVGDWKWMRGHGINTVRIPVGYYHLLAGASDSATRDLLKHTDYAPYAAVYSGAWDRFLRAISTARSHGFGVLVDLHAAPGSQNTDGHSGTSSGRVGLFEGKDAARNQELTCSILAMLAREIASHDNVVGLELLNEPKNNGGLQAFYERAIASVRGASDEARKLPIYVGDGWDTNHYAGWVGQRGNAGNFLVVDYHLYRCFTPGDHALAPEEHASAVRPGGKTCDWLGNMSSRAKGNLIVGEWSTALNPGSFNKTSRGNHGEARKEWGLAQYEAYEQHCAGYFFWTLKKEGGTDAGWSLYGAIERGALPASFDPLAGRSPDIGALRAAGKERGQQALQAHYNYWDSHGKGQKMEHWRFEEGFNRGWEDACAFFERNQSLTGGDNGAEIGFIGQWAMVRTEVHKREKGDGSIWEYEHGLQQGVQGFAKAVRT